ncbi:MAG: methyltransferase [Tissierellia bacterium]|nr:methyltransferase [Tissierellia bacterium]
MERIDYIPGTDYKIIQNKTKFSFGIDSILLSSFANIREDLVVVDIGTGVGILALRCHKLYKTKKVYAYEIQREIADMAKRSVALNRLENEIEVINVDINNIDRHEKVDCIITNPPYMESGRGIENQDKSKLISLYEKKLKLEDIFVFSDKFLKNRGKLFMVIRSNRLIDMVEMARKYGIEPVRMRSVHSFSNTKSKLVLMEFVKSGGKNFVLESPLVIYEKPGLYTEEVKGFYE